MKRKKITISLLALAVSSQKVVNLDFELQTTLTFQSELT